VIRDQIPEEPELVWAAQQVRHATHSSDLVVSDHPIVAYLADRRTPGPLVDTAVLRFANGSLSPDDVLRTLDGHRVAAVVAGRAFTEQPRVLAGILDRYTPLATRRGMTVYVRRG
jgi:hypothetical protein